MLCSDVVPVTQTLGGVSYVFTGMLKIRGDKGNQPEWNVVKNWNDVYSLRYEDNKLQYRSSADKKWTSVPSLGLCAFYEQVWNSDASNDVKVVVGDWPYGKNDNTGEKKKQIRIRVVDNDSGKEIYDSGAMRYSDGSSGNYGKIKFNCLDSIYEVNRVTVQKNSGATSDVAYNPETGVSVNFDSTKGDEHYVVTAYVGARAFSVSYDLVGGGDSEDFAASQVKPIDGNKVSVSPTTPTKDGFVFGGWQFDGTVYEPGDDFVMPAQDVVLVAKWIPASETITYSATLGGTVTRATELVKKDPSAQTSGSKAIANMQGYKFMGWYEGSQVSPEGYPVSGAEPVSKSESFKPKNKAASYKAVFVRVDAKISGYSGVYDGNDHGVVLESSLLDSLWFKAEYSNDGGETWSSENPAYKNVEFDSDGNVASRSVKARIVTTVGSIVVWSDSAEITISKRAVTVSANGTRPYNGGVQTLEIAASSVTAGSLAADDSFASGVVGKVKGEAAGTYTEVVEKAASIVRDGVDVSANYEVTVSGSLTITQAEAASYKAAVSLDGWTYGDQAAAEQPSVEGPGAEDYAAPTYTYYKDGEQLDAKPTDAGEYSVTASWAATASLPALTATDTFRISKRAVNLSSDSASKPYDGTALTRPDVKVDGDGFVAGEATARATGSVTEVVEGDVANRIEIVRGVKFKESNYNITLTEGTLRILASGENDVTIDGINGLDGRGIVKTYDGQAVAVVAEAAIRENSTVEYSVEGGAWTTQQPTFLNAGTYEVAVRATNPNYETVEKAVTVVVNRAPVTVAAVAASKTAGAADPALTATVSGLVNGEPAGLISYTVARTAGELVGSYQIVPTGLAIQGNYAVTYVPATLTISAAPVVPPTVTPVVPTAPVVTPTAVTPAPTPAAPAAPAPAAPAAAPATATPAPAAEPIEDDATPQAAAPAERTPLAETEEIEDEGTPMGAFDEPHCWVHWVMLLGILITAAYGAIVVRRRLHLADEVDDYEKQVLGIEDEATEAVPATGRQAL